MSPEGGYTKSGVNPWLVAPVVALAAFMEVLDISIANVSLQHISGDLSAGQDESTWVLTSYLVTNAIVLPVSGWLSSVMGRKRFFLACIAGFSVSSLLCGLAPTLALLIVARAIQGLTGGGLQPSAQAILADTFPPRQRGMAFALYGMSVVFAPAIGPTLGGWITDTASWRWVFLLNVPVGVVLSFLVTAMVEDPPHLREAKAERTSQKLRIDYLGFLLLSMGLGLLQVVLDRGEQEDWYSSPFILWSTIISATSLVAFVLWELGQDDPIVDLHLLLNRNFALSNVLMFLLGFVLLGSTVLLPSLVQRLFGYTATEAGLVITPGGFSIMLLMPIIGKLVSSMDSRYLIAAGLAITAGALFHMTGFNLETDYAHFMWARVYQAMGLSLLFIPINTLAYLGLDRTKSSSASALINMSRNLGGSFGIALVVTYLSRQSQIHQSTLVGHATPADPAYRHMIQSLSQSFLTMGDSLQAAHNRALAQIGQIISGQAQMMGFIDDFAMLGWIFLLLIPVVFLMRPAPRHTGPVEGAH
ncbi:MAG TPA: DHA2 family efflux MFS transporter permease subunit [Candidatus Sulfotelmatobacter sp.]|jgi:DHA2 family multidrug resistance protein|nr:DHA2 family efflux MFS transporter permease subunit [Candidatus Sulfotelmatobacter sp.]